MKATFKQEWKAGKKRILYTSIVLAAVLLGTVLINFIAYQTKSGNITFFGMFLYKIGIVAGTIGIPVYALVRGGGNIKSILFGDTNYLMLLIPEHSWALLCAKQILNLAEYIIYAVPAAFYLSFMGPTLGLVMKTNINGFSVNGGSMQTYWNSVKQIYKFVLVKNLADTLQYAAACIILFFVLQSAINCAYALYSAFIHTKKPNPFLIGLIIFLLFYIPMRVGFLGMQNFTLYGNNASANLWNYLWRFAVFGACYFALTSWLLEKKIEV